LLNLIWNRELACSYCNNSHKQPIKPYNHVFLGHTSTQFASCNNSNDKPITSQNVTLVDTGAGWIGKLTIMNVDTLEYWQSDEQLAEP
jgi:serine/threonine protein phosphatase 1